MTERTYEATKPRQLGTRPAAFALPGSSRGGANTVPASQARAARRREARRDEQAVAAWLRELSARSR